MAVRDPKTEQMRIDIYKQMSGEEKVRIAWQMYEDAILEEQRQQKAENNAR